MSVDDILYSPVIRWRQLCPSIITWIDNHRTPDRLIYPLDRQRPTGALYLEEFLELYWEFGQRFFWRLHNPTMLKFELHMFEFDGTVIESNDDLPYPAYSEVGWDYYRSIEDVNLVPNTYTRYFIFGNEEDAVNGVSFVQNFYP